LRGARDKLDTAKASHHVWYVNAETGLGLVLAAAGRGAEARDLLEPTVEFSRRYLGENHIRTQDAQLALGRALLANGEYAKAEPVLVAAAAAFEPQRRTQPYFAAQASAALAEVRRRRGSKR